MPDTTDSVAEQIERSVGDAPPSPVDLDALLRQGRRAQLRRRLALGAGTAAAALVVGGGAWALSPGGDTSAAPDEPPVADQPSSGALADERPEDDIDARELEERLDAAADFRLSRAELASYDPAGRLVVRDGWRVVQRIPNPFEHAAPERSVGLELTDGSQSHWYLLEYAPSTLSAASVPAQQGFATLDEWVADQVAINGGGAEPSTFVELGPDGDLVPLAGVTIVEQRAGVDLGEDFAAAADTWVAEVRVEGRRAFVSVRRMPGGSAQYFPVTTSKAGTTLDSFIEYSRSQYASGEGVR